MKNLMLLVTALILFMAGLAGCGDSPAPPPEMETPVAAIKHHDTRVVVICKTGPGQYSKKSLHKSESVTCGAVTVRLEDFAKACEDRYVAFPGREKELEEYLKVAAEEKR